LRARANAHMHRRAFVRPCSQAHVSWFSARLVTGCRLILRLDCPLSLLFLLFFCFLFRFSLSLSLLLNWENINERERERRGRESEEHIVFFFSSLCIFAFFLVCKDAIRDLWSPRRPSSDHTLPRIEKKPILLSMLSFFRSLHSSPTKILRCDHTQDTDR